MALLVLLQALDPMKQLFVGPLASRSVVLLIIFFCISFGYLNYTNDKGKMFCQFKVHYVLLSPLIMLVKVFTPKSVVILFYTFSTFFATLYYVNELCSDWLNTTQTSFKMLQIMSKYDSLL